MFKCQRCGRCVVSCPVLSVMEWESFSPRSRVVLSLAKSLGNIEVGKEFLKRIFSCTTCRACEVVCPAGVRIADIVIHTREQMVKMVRD
ncbi:MAG: (Fe-S)-binding protein [Nitrososphaerota archaeon]|nr:(Fe-S)-binding protein [Nitrososphaerota archaeon]